MFNDIMNYFETLPKIKMAVTVALFIIFILLNRIFKMILKKKYNKVPENNLKFWQQFLKTEYKFIRRSFTGVSWMIFLSFTIYLWLAHLTRLFAALNNFYAPLVRAIVIVIIMFLVLKISRIVIKQGVAQVAQVAGDKIKRGKKRVATLNHILNYISTTVIVTISALMLMNTFGINIGAILASVGIASVAIGFGAQSLVKDIISGLFILSEDQYAVGDVAIINGEGGFVEKMTLRITQLRNTEGMLITIPNGNINVVKNLTSEWSRVDYKIGVAYDTDMEHALKVLEEEAIALKEEMSDVITDAPEILGIDEFGNSEVTLRLFIKTVPLQQWSVRRAYNKKVFKRFEAEGIEIPFPQSTLWIKEPKEAIFEKLAALKTN